MSPLMVTVLRLAYLGLLWLLVLLVMQTVRKDVFGATIKEKRGKSLKRGTATAAGYKSKGGGLLNQPEAMRLVVTSGPLAGASLELSGGAVTFGRAPNCSLVLDDEYASSMHAKIYQRDGRYYLADMNSTNGTFLNDERVVDEIPLQLGQEIRIGRTVIEVSK